MGYNNNQVLVQSQPKAQQKFQEPVLSCYVSKDGGTCFSGGGDGKLNQWNNLMERALTEDILSDRSKFNMINGISITPKKEWNCFKISLRIFRNRHGETMLYC